MMKLEGKNILLVSPEPWDHVFVSKHHYAVHLAKRGNTVFFLNPPSGTTGISPSIYPNLLIVEYAGFFPGLRYLPTLVRKWLTKRVFNRLEKEATVRFDIIWSFDNSVFFQLDALPDRVFKISHTVDLNQDFEVATSGRTADLTLFNSTPIGARLRKLSIDGHFINHGLHVYDQLTPISLPPHAGIRVGYAGNLDIQYIDWIILQQVVNAFPNALFHFAGSATHPHVLAFLNGNENVQWMGKLASNALPSYYEQMDVLIIAYHADDEPDQLANPHKVLEYLRSGRPIVATYTAEYADKDLLYMSRTNAEWPGLFATLITHLEEYSTPELQAKRKAYALENTYDKQLDRIEELIESSDEYIKTFTT